MADVARAHLPLAVFAIAACVAACSVGRVPPRFDVVTQAPASPVVRGQAVLVHPPIVGEITVDGRPEHEAIASFSDKEVSRWGELLAAARGAIREGLVDNRGALELAKDGEEAPAVEIVLTSIDLARHDPRGNPKLKLAALLRVFAADGSVADEVRLHAIVEAEQVGADALEATRERRFKRGGSDLGRQAAEYLRVRAGID